MSRTVTEPRPSHAEAQLRSRLSAGPSYLRKCVYVMKWLIGAEVCVFISLSVCLHLIVSVSQHTCSQTGSQTQQSQPDELSQLSASARLGEI